MVPRRPDKALYQLEMSIDPPNEDDRVPFTLMSFGALSRHRTPTCSTLVIGARHDTMDPGHLAWMAGAFANGRYLLCPEGQSPRTPR